MGSANSFTIGFPHWLEMLKIPPNLEPTTVSAPELSSFSMNWGVLWTWKLPVLKAMYKLNISTTIILVVLSVLSHDFIQFHHYIYISTLYPHSKTMITDYISPLCFQETTWSITWGSFTKHPTPSAPRFPADPGQSGWILTPGVGMSWWFH